MRKQLRSSTFDGQPLLRWAGSKRKLLPQLIQLVPRSFDRYIEPFAGSACLFAALQPTRAILGDLNKELIHAYSMVGEIPDKIAALVLQYPRTPSAYYRIRSLDPASLDEAERAARFIYLNRFCFNGVYRTNQNGMFNVPRGSKVGPLPTAQDFRHWSQLLRRAELVPGDFRLCIATASRGDFVYLDPPYTLNDERYRGEYGYGSFDSSDLKRLADSLKQLDQKGAAFVLSYRYKRAVQERFTGWYQRAVTVHRHVGGFSATRRNVRELLISNRPMLGGRNDR